MYHSEDTIIGYGDDFVEAPISDDDFTCGVIPTRFKARPIKPLPKLKPKKKEIITVDGKRYCLDIYYERLKKVNKDCEVYHEYKFKNLQ
jgi:hypothetical protein